MKVIIFLLLSFCVCEQIPLYTNKATIKFAEIQKYQIAINDITMSKMLVRYSYLSVTVTVNKTPECVKSKMCNQPLRIYGQLNESPEIENIKYDKKDDKGQLLGEDKVIYVFEYSACEYKLTDTLFLKIHGIEGQANYEILVSFINSQNYISICSSGDFEAPITKEHSLTPNQDFFVKFGGRSVLENVPNNNIYLLDANLSWIQKSPKTQIPSARFGHSAFIFGDFLLIYGGEDGEAKKLNDLWAYSLTGNYWLELIKNGNANMPIKKSHVSNIALESHGIVIFFGGILETPIDDKKIYLLNLRILKQIIDYKEGNIKIFDYNKAVSNLWENYSLEIQSRFGHSMIEQDGFIYLFGGFDINQNMINGMHIIDLNLMTVETLDSQSDWPVARVNHGTLSYGSIFIMYGGEKSNGEVLNELWKFDIFRRKWFLIDEPKKETEAYLYRTDFDFIIYKNSPLIYSGFKQSHVYVREFMSFNFEPCQNDIQNLSSDACLPCAEGTFLTRHNTCQACNKGYYHRHRRLCQLGLYCLSRWNI